MCSYVNLTLDDVDMTANKVGNANALVFLAIGVDPAELVITNGSNLTMYGTYGVGTNAAENANVEITINGNSEIVAQANGGDSIGLFANVSAKISIENATISGEKVGVLLRGIGKENDPDKKAKIKNSTISSTGTGAYEMYEESNWESGTGVPAAAIVVGSKNGNYHRSTTVEFGEKVTLTHASESAVDIYVYQENESYPVTVSGDIDPSWTNNTDMNEASYPEAKVGDQNYTTLQEAIEASGTNNTVEILKDVDLSKSMSGGSHCGIKIEKALTLNGNGHELYNNKDIDKGNCSLVQIGHDSGKLTAVITLKDVKIKNYGTVSYVKGDNAPYSGSRLIDIWEIENTSTNNENPDGAVYFNNVEIYSTNAGAGMYYRGISFWGNKNAVVSLMKSKVDIPSYYAIYLYNDEKVELKIEESTINGWAIIDNYGENDLVVTANKSVFNSTNIYDANGSTWNDFGAVKFEGNETNATENARMTCTDCTFNVTAKSTAKQYLANLSAQGTLELNNCTINPSGEAYGILSGGGTIKLTGCSVRQSDGTYQIITSDDYK